MESSGSGQDALYASLFPRVISKAEKRKIQIVEGAIACYATLGLDKTTYESIAAKCKASRTLIIHYFPERDDLIKMVIQYIRADGQNYSIERMKGAKTPEDLLRFYIQSMFEWVNKKPYHWTVWMLFFYFCGTNRIWKAMHTEMARMGHERIKVLLENLPSNKKVSQKELYRRAKNLQAYMTGALVTSHVENLSISRIEFATQVEEDCLKFAKGI